MINEEKKDKAFRTIQDLLIEGRTMAHKLKSDSSSNQENTFYEFFDWFERLVGFTIEPNTDSTAFFEQYLEEMCKEYNCNHVFIRYLQNCSQPGLRLGK